MKMKMKMKMKKKKKKKKKNKKKKTHTHSEEFCANEGSYALPIIATTPAATAAAADNIQVISCDHFLN